MPLDSSERYTVRIEVGNPQSGYEVFQPQYFSCATQACLQSDANLDISDPGTFAYVRALDAQVFKDIGLGATVTSLAVPSGVVGTSAAALGVLASIGSAGTDSTILAELINGGSQAGAERVLVDVLGHSAATATRVIALIYIAGGWDAFVNRVKIDLLEINAKTEK